MSYDTMKYSTARKIVANCDKLSTNSMPRRVNSPWGTISICKPRLTNEGYVRQYSVRGSSVLHNGGGYTIGGLRKRLLGI